VEQAKVLFFTEASKLCRTNLREFMLGYRGTILGDRRASMKTLVTCCISQGCTPANRCTGTQDQNGLKEVEHDW
jgi:hypothetical protein